MSQQISEKAKNAAEQISNNHGVPESDVVEEYQKYRAEEADKGVSDPEKRALRRLGISYKGSQTQGASQLMGYVLGATDPINTSRSDIRNAKQYISNHGPDKAVERGMVKRVPNGVPDGMASVTVTGPNGDETHYAVIDTNNNSPTSGEVLPEEDYIRYVYGAAWRSPEDGPHLFSGVLSADDPGEEPPAPETGEPVEFPAVWVGDSNNSNTVRLRFRSPDPFSPTDAFGGPDPIETLEDMSVELAEADSDNYGRNDVVVTYGSVDYMELAPGGDQSRRLSLIDPFTFGDDLQRTVWVPDHEEVNFAGESDVYVVGQVSPSNNEYPDSIEAVGVVPHPDYVVDRSGIESMADDGGNGGPAPDPDPEPEPEAEPTGDTTPASEAGAELADPDTVETDHEAGFETGATIDSSEQADKAERGEHLPPVVKDANYPELQTVASGTDEVPGSGIGEDEMRDQLVDAMGPEALAERLVDNAAAETDGGEPAGEPDAETDTGAGAADEGGSDEWEW